MPSGLDHIVHAVRDLDAAAALYRRLGFTVGARNRHPWGTHNHIVQLPGFFIELLTLAEPEKLGDDGFSRLFGAFNRDFVAKGEGLSLLLLQSADAAADERAFRAAGIAESEVMRFEREGKRPDGSSVKLAFSLAFARDANAPAQRFAVCQQHYPENFWKPAFQNHPNGATAIAGVVLVASDPAQHAEFLSAYSNATVTRGDKMISARTPRGEISVMQPSRYREEFTVDVNNVSRGTQIAAIRIATHDVGNTAARLKDAGLAPTRRGDKAIVGPGAAMGAAFIFEPVAG